ncbi:hypothetical protein BMS3Abin04_03116 [bacterium BMS3Abin04]|nr:hypothetical protein BMS3Abin04_03116 [bacterium BMS3Abin04]
MPSPAVPIAILPYFSLLATAVILSAVELVFNSSGNLRTFIGCLFGLTLYNPSSLVPIQMFPKLSCNNDSMPADLILFLLLPPVKWKKLLSTGLYLYKPSSNVANQIKPSLSFNISVTPFVRYLELGLVKSSTFSIFFVFRL